MTQITKRTNFSELLIANSFLIPVVNRFGIKLGLGDKTVAAVCKENDVDVYFFMTIMRIYMGEEQCCSDEFDLFDVSEVLDFLKTTTEHFAQSSIPNIEKHLSPLIAMSDSDNEELKLLHNIIAQFKSDFASYTQQELSDIKEYPYELLHDLKSILIKHISGNYNQNLAYAVIFSIDSLERELDCYNKIFNRLLVPKLDELDSENIESLNHLLAEEQKSTDNKCHLTNREIEILKLIVQGHTNKEIADQLNISLNTVLSHRKNIISKTGIKTVSGLTFYAISNGYASSGNFKI